MRKQKEHKSPKHGRDQQRYDCSTRHPAESLTACLVALHSGIKAIEEYIAYQRAIHRPFSSRTAYCIKDDMELAVLYDAFRAALNTYLALKGITSDSCGDLADGLLADSEQALKKWLGN